jgi:UDP-N-acetylmuramate--alanine ligase
MPMNTLDATMPATTSDPNAISGGPALPAIAAGPIWPAAPGLPALTPGQRVHLVGLGGAGMSGLARALAALGLRVSGSDRQDSPLLAALAAEGIEVRIGHAAAQLPADCALVVRTPAVPDENPELAAARAAGIPITKRAVLLGALMDARIGVAVAGTHGKTTTSGMMAAVLVAAGLDPSFFIGGEVLDLGTNARMGAGPQLVIEADEYDWSFLHGHPAIAIITNVEHDHPDIYPTAQSVVDAFAAFAGNVRPDGRIIACASSPLVHDAVRGAGASVEWYHVAGDPIPHDLSSPDSTIPMVHWTARDLAATPDGQLFDVRRGEECLGTWAIRLGGRHNVGNALAVIAAAEALGVDRQATRRALAGYRGTERRFQVLGHAAGVTVVDDYAHHPTEIAATLAAARQRFPGRPIHAIVQPHTYSRVALLADAFAASLLTADRVTVTPIYAARETPPPGVDAARIASGIPGADVATNLGAAADTAAARASEGDVLLFLGAGDITDASRSCLDLLRRRDAERLVRVAAERGLGGEVLGDEPVARHTSLKVGGPADVAVRVRIIGDLAGWWSLAQALGISVHVLGRGTNVLVADAGVQGLVLINRCEGWRMETGPGVDSGTSLVVIAESGVTLAALGQTLARDGLAGIEAGVGIPGSVGAGVVTNAGAHGWAMADSVIEAEVLEADGTARWWTPEDLAFRYRGSALKGDANRLVLRATLRVRRDDPAAILARIAAYTAHRRATQPATPSVGSIFKNPPGDHAGRLIEAVGLKGSTAGGAEISPLHANFFVNRGGARAADILQLVDRARRAVQTRFGITLEPEIERLGGDAAVPENPAIGGQHVA